MIYIDLGCNNGKTIIDFYKNHDRSIKSIGIDPLGEKYPKEWDAIRLEYGTLFMKRAALDFNGEIEFSERSDDVKSSVMKEKIRFKNGRIYTVDCFDFADYIKYIKKHRIYLRMDIEGAEYPVLIKMIKDGMMERVEFLEVEWHSRKMTDPKYAQQEKEIKEFIKANNIKYTEIT